VTNEIVLLVIGATVGILSTVGVELIKHNLEKKRLRQERETNSFLARERDVIDLLATEGQKNYTPAWLKLVDTQKPIIVWRRMTGNPRQAGYIRSNPENATTSSLNALKTAQLSKSEHNNFIESARSKKSINKYILGRTQIIGRHNDCEIQLSDPSVSRLHCMIRCEQGNYLIYDLGSSSGTFINGTRVDEMGIMLMNQDVIIAGNSVFVFEKIAAAMKKSQSADGSDIVENQNAS
jgi:hypothetical protein